MTAIIMRVDVIHDNVYKQYELRRALWADPTDQEVEVIRQATEREMALKLNEAGVLWNSAIGPLIVELARVR